MARASTPEIPINQEQFCFEDRYIDRHDLDGSAATQAAKHRIERRDELALTARTQGFRRRTRLWIPHSGQENSAVVDIPTNYVKASQRLIESKVVEKYELSNISPNRVLLWAWFAKNRVGREKLELFRVWRHEATEEYRSINMALEPDGRLDRDKLEGSDVAMGALTRYISHLQAWVGHPDTLGKGEKRKWLRPDWKHNYSQRLQRSADYLAKLHTPEFLATTQEAFYAEQSRSRYWANVLDEYKHFWRGNEMTERLARESLPLDVLAVDSRADPANYVDGDYIL